MINSIPKIEQKTLKAFGQVTQKQTVSDYWLPVPPAQDKFEKNNDNNEGLSSKIRIITPEEARKTNNLKIIGLSIAGTVVLTAAGIFFVLKGGGKGLTKNFQKLRDTLQKKIQDSKLSSNNLTTSPNRFYIVMVKALDGILSRSEAINNFTSFKDMLFKNLMNFSKYTCKIHDNITRLFEKIGRQTVLNGYKKTSGFLEQAVKTANNAVVSTADKTKIIDGKTKAQWLEQAQTLTEELVGVHNAHFDSHSLTKRYFSFKKAAQDLKVAFEKLKIFLTKDLFKTFLADSKISKEKVAIQKSILGYRRELTYSATDMAKISDELILKLTQFVSFKDSEKLKLLADIRTNIKIYAKNPVKNANLKDNILKDIDNLTKNLKASSTSEIPDNSTRNLLEGLDSLRTELVNFKQGKVQDILDIYKKVLTPNEFKTLEKSFKHYTKSLDSSIKVESEDFINKLRDLSLGSAPTDILSLLGGLGVLGYHLGKSDDNDQRISIALKYGIPALSLIGVSLYCNAKLYAGTKGLLIGTISSAILNRIGSTADNMLKEHRAKNPPKNV